MSKLILPPKPTVQEAVDYARRASVSKADGRELNTAQAFVELLQNRKSVIKKMLIVEFVSNEHDIESLSEIVEIMLTELL